ncbi:hypothetical protein [Paenibacillus silvae]|uniref:hypothetical protein n=1 Tax=Paenibacillus silvae TaxID=1325358 RepID=UPI002002A7EA|nr:hypothetical protein [Paenibacillus silvae]MCK6076515.1 hypothetical protein [Paenibacillus silvae]MCK6150942.1 hypothetical protein [Paenibacillus silvae]MCK6269202.1 hypothetical protein [Paenibacillus silvae]
MKRLVGLFSYVELEAEVSERLERNRSENRLQHKPTKCDLVWSEQDLLDSMKYYRLNPKPGEITHERYLRINNTSISPDQTARLIQEYFSL